MSISASINKARYTTLGILIGIPSIQCVDSLNCPVYKSINVLNVTFFSKIMHLSTNQTSIELAELTTRGH